MKNTEPEKLSNKTPLWFKGWHNGFFWHFKYGVESKLAAHDRLLWLILSAIILAAIANIFFVGKV